MDKTLRIGTSDFRKYIESDGYFIDKTLLIKEVIDSTHEVLVFPRPRRFGKTLNLSMLKYFFDCNKKDTAKLFKDFEISRCEKKYTEKQGQYPVIFLTLKDVKKETFEGCIARFKSLLSDLYIEHNYLLKSDVLDANEKINFERIIKEEANIEKYEASLKHLSKSLSEYHKQSVLILIDEYDTPIHAGYSYNYYNQVISFMRNFMSDAFKDNEYLYKGVITGILRIARESIFSGLNNPGIFTILNYSFADKFGFTENETLQLLKDSGLADKIDMVRHWYNGYKFGDTENIYNPWSISNYIAMHREGFKPYWVNTSSDDLIRKRINEKDGDEIRNDIERLIKGETIEKNLNENMVFPDLNTDKELLWSLLTFSGYLTTVKNVKEKLYELKIPNYEITTLFKEIILGWLNTSLKLGTSLLYKTVESLKTNQTEQFKIQFKKLIGDTLSYYDIATEPEKVYHAYVLGLLTIVSDEYVIKSNRESGDGRYDILLRPYDVNSYGIVIEIKTLPKDASKRQIAGKLSAALRQISKNRYYNELLENHVTNHIQIAMVFAGKDVHIKTKANTC